MPEAASRPPCALTIERQIDSPMPMPLDLVVKKASNSRSAFSAATPGNANNAPPNPAPNFLATLELNTGAVTPVPGITFQAKGLVFVSGEGDEGDDS